MQFFRCWIVLSGLFILCLLCCPVQGDMLMPTNTHVFFEKDGQPFNESIQFSVSCYGYRWSPAEGSGSTVTPSPDKKQDIVFSYAATCPEYGCTIYEPYYLNYRHIDRCDLEGTTWDGNFTIRNFSTTPVPNCTDIQQVDVVSGKHKYYRGTPDYQDCLNKSHAAFELCDQFLAECYPGSDPECGNWIRDGRYVKDTNESRACRNDADLNRKTCDAYLEKVDPSTLVMWHDIGSGDEYPADRICEQRFVIPSIQNLTQSGNDTFVPPSQAAHIEMDSVWCHLLQAFGVGCR